MTFQQASIFSFHVRSVPLLLSIASSLNLSPFSSFSTAKFAEYDRGRTHIYKHVFHPAVSKIEIASISCVCSLCAAVLIHLYKCVPSLVCCCSCCSGSPYISLAVLELRELTAFASAGTKGVHHHLRHYSCLNYAEQFITNTLLIQKKLAQLLS